MAVRRGQSYVRDYKVKKLKYSDNFSDSLGKEIFPFKIIQI